jgi:hypothetical protein
MRTNSLEEVGPSSATKKEKKKEKKRLLQENDRAGSDKDISDTDS